MHLWPSCAVSDVNGARTCMQLGRRLGCTHSCVIFAVHFLPCYTQKKGCSQGTSRRTDGALCAPCDHRNELCEHDTRVPYRMVSLITDAAPLRACRERRGRIVGKCAVGSREGRQGQGRHHGQGLQGTECCRGNAPDMLGALSAL